MLVRVLILDQSAFFRKAVQDVLNADREIEVIGAVAIDDLTPDILHLLDPDVVVVDPERLSQIHDAMAQFQSQGSIPYVSVTDSADLVNARGPPPLATIVKRAVTRRGMGSDC